MPLIKSAVKKMKQDRRRYAQNLRTKRAMRDAVKAFSAKPTWDGLRAAQSAIDTAVKKHVITKAAAARRLSGLVKIAKTAGVKVAAVKKAAAKPTASKAAKPATKATAKPAAKKPATKTAAKPATKKTATKTTK